MFKNTLNRFEPNIERYLNYTTQFVDLARKNEVYKILAKFSFFID